MKPSPEDAEVLWEAVANLDRLIMAIYYYIVIPLGRFFLEIPPLSWLR